MGDPLGDSDENALVKLTSLLVLGAGLVSLFLGYGWFWMVFAVGFAVVVPIVKLVTNELGGEGTDTSTTGPDRESHADRLGTDASESKQDALDTLRARYASGELGEAEFERKVERLLETETLEDARDHVTNRSEADRRDSKARDRDRATER